mmetsp:Transcript_30197/g.79313  ORF Transcript_30197/g.79313 Transcript_30197/m.79313 type:complete len:388 (+) Transcript_30197:260-1423(+)
MDEGLFRLAVTILLAVLVGIVADYIHSPPKAQQQLTAVLEMLARQKANASVAVSPGSIYRAARSSPRVMQVDTSRMLFDRDEHTFMLVADLDLKSRHPSKFLWSSILRKGMLRRQGNGSYAVEWTLQHTLESRIAYKNRSMELSELVQYGHVLMGFCDITGLVFKVTADEKRANVLLRYAIADGDGHSIKPFKSEWATVKDGLVWVGSTGKEWNDWDPATGKEYIKHRNTLWVKTIEESGRITNYDWSAVYTALRTATNTTFPGYLWHEAVLWDPRLARWLFLPRRASPVKPYRPDTDQHMGTNVLISTSEDFSDIAVHHIGPVEPEWGFSSLRKIPGTDAQYVALKTFEVGDETHSKLVRFNLDGLYEEVADLPGVKYEGLEFIEE